MSDPEAVLAHAFWITGPLQSGWQSTCLPPLPTGEVRVRTLHTAISRGTETLVYRGQVPASEMQRMRAPFQQGEFPFPVKYGYVNVGVVEQGPEPVLGQTVFCLHPHQTLFQVPLNRVVPVPAGVPAARAVLAANLETAVNALWDADQRIGQRVAVVGAGTLGLLVAWLAAQVPGCRVEVIDVEASRAAVAATLGARFALPEQASPDADLVVHTSASESGLATALKLAAFEATVLELSWYGNREVRLPLGEAFHARRLQIRSSQVGSVATAMRHRWTQRQRLELSLSLLTDARLDALITHHAPWEHLPEVMARLAGPGAADVLCHRIDFAGPMPAPAGT